MFRKSVEGHGGRGFVVQDINASKTVCMSTIMSVERYPGIVPHVKAAAIYDRDVEANVRIFHTENGSI